MKKWLSNNGLEGYFDAAHCGEAGHVVAPVYDVAGVCDVSGHI